MSWRELVGDTTRIRQELGYAEEVAREEALRPTIAWERARLPNTPSDEEMQRRNAGEDLVLDGLA